jgi:predicted ATP-grasp superfamily ATP-dependent carboligase
MASPPTAIVFGLGITGLGVVRALGRAGIPVIGLWSGCDEVGRFSRYCRAVRVPLGADLLALLREVSPPGEKPTLFSTNDAAAQWVSEHQDELREGFRFHTLEPSLLSRINSKDGIIDLLAGHEVETPYTTRVETLQQYEQAAPALRFPVLVKPADTFRRTLPGREKNLLFPDLRSLDSFVRKAPQKLPDIVMQEVVPSGDGYIWFCALLFDAQSRLVMSFTCRKLRQYLPDFGCSSFSISERNDEVARLSSSVMQRLGFRGVCMLEFAQDRYTGKLLLLEINVRASVANQLYADCGCDFPLAEYRLLTGGHLPPLGPQRYGVHWINLACDLGTWYRKRREIPFGRWLRSVLRARSFAVAAADDPLPWAWATAQMFKGAARRLCRVVRPRAEPAALPALLQEQLVQPAIPVHHRVD